MASTVATLPSPLLLANARTTLLTASPKLPVSFFRGQPETPLQLRLRERQVLVAIVARATKESSESSSTLSIVESVQNVWDNSEDQIAFVGLGFAAIVALWASANLITAIDRLPLLPTVLELVGVLYSSWFIYRYLLFKPNREELFKIANKSISDILGQ